MNRRCQTEKVISVRMTKEMHSKLRKTAYLLEIPIAQLIRTSIDKMLRDQKDLAKP